MKRLQVWKITLFSLALGLSLAVAPSTISKAAEGDVEINETNFPDQKFRKYVSRFDLDENGVLEETEIAQVKKMNLSDKRVKSVEGIKTFYNLKKFEYHHCQLTSLDLSNMTKLREVDVAVRVEDYEDMDDAPRPKGETWDSDFWDLEEINLTGCTELERLSCYANQINKLEISGCVNLFFLDCNNNKLTNLDISSNKNLKGLYCDNNQIEELDLTECGALIMLDCSYNKIKSLDFGSYNELGESTSSYVPELLYLICNDNLFTGLDLKPISKLKYLNCNNNQLTELNISQNPELYYLECNGNQLADLDVSQNPELKQLRCDDNQLRQLDLSQVPLLWYLSCCNNQLAYIDLSMQNKITSDVNFQCRGNMLRVPFYSSGIKVEGLDLSRISNIKGAKLVDGKLIPNADAKVVQYSYDTKAPNVQSHRYTVFTLARAVHEHEALEGWKSDKTYHWQVCSCGEIMNKAEHDLTSEIEPASLKKNGAEKTVCKVCERVTNKKVIDRPKSFSFSKKKYEYTGKVMDPKLTIKNTKGYKITDQYYGLKKPSGRKNVGKYTYKVTFKGKFTGTKKVSFIISPKKIQMKSISGVNRGFKVSWKKRKEQTSGYSIRYSEKNDMSYSTYVDIEGNKKGSKTIKKLEPNKEYYVQLRTFKTVKGKKYYSEWCEPKQVKTK